MNDRLEIAMDPLQTKPDFSREEVSRVAFLNWEKDGCPHGRDLDYWLEAEHHLKATWHMHVGEHVPHKGHATSAEKKPRRAALRMVARPKAA